MAALSLAFVEEERTICPDRFIMIPHLTIQPLGLDLIIQNTIGMACNILFCF